MGAKIVECSNDMCICKGSTIIEEMIRQMCGSIYIAQIPLTKELWLELKYCPKCGRKLHFLKSEEERLEMEKTSPKLFSYNDIMDSVGSLPKGEYQITYDSELDISLYHWEQRPSDYYPCPAEYSETCRLIPENTGYWNCIASGADDVIAKFRELNVWAGR
ncbi:MAG: hypothetical protein PHE17_19420 [Thiothrix sp.]|uniref:hypothetical protein n=1 Tax=Thiothrix sp. TaxID=1032 RepID=UPI00262A878F|nr:hypothetical protein [Thiothrix sp.]MDD5395198.1 hypothetical protein [Thiothrix sp.]